jgi:hypothetical protein
LCAAWLPLDLDRVRGIARGRVLEPDAELVLLEDAQLLQLRGDDLQGVEIAPLAFVPYCTTTRKT